jgi:hypothetical protein
MITWPNLAFLILASLLLLYYVRSVSPAGRARVVGAREARICRGLLSALPLIYSVRMDSPQIGGDIA